MRNIRWTIRLTLLILILISIGGITSSYLSFQSQTTAQQEVTAGTITETDGITVVTTAPAASRRNGQLIAFDEGGNPVYQNSSFDFYFDVDPSLNQEHSVTYVAGNLVDPPKCGARPASGKCGFISVERVNLVTGKVTRIYQEFNRPHIYHDVDRINDSHLLFADIANHRVFMVDLRSGITSWGWSAQINYSVQGGGFFPDDWTHLNDVEYLPDGRIMVSLRNQDQVVFLDKQTGLQENWTLGSENDHSILYEQHNPDYIPTRMGGPAVIVADSENNRVIEYQRTDSGTWNETWSWSDARLHWPRDADRLPNGNTLIVDADGNRVVEVASNGSVVWTVGVDTPYDVERLGTGPESEGGRSASQLELRGTGTRAVGETAGKTGSANSGAKGIIKRIWIAVKSIIPGPIINGFFFLLPRWAGFREVLVMGLGSLSAAALVIVELYWSPVHLRTPWYRES